MSSIEKQYEDLEKILDDVNVGLLDCKEAEPYYLRFLIFLKDNSDSRNYLAKKLIYRLEQGIQPWEADVV